MRQHCSSTPQGNQSGHVTPFLPASVPACLPARTCGPSYKGWRRPAARQRAPVFNVCASPSFQCVCSEPERSKSRHVGQGRDEALGQAGKQAQKSERLLLGACRPVRKAAPLQQHRLPRSCCLPRPCLALQPSVPLHYIYLSSDRATCSLMDPKACDSVTRPGFCTKRGWRGGWGGESHQAGRGTRGCTRSFPAQQLADTQDAGHSHSTPSIRGWQALRGGLCSCLTSTMCSRMCAPAPPASPLEWAGPMPL